MSFNEKKVRDEFPILSRKINGKKLVYLDNAATTQKPKTVINALSRFYKRHNANIHRGLHTLSMEASEMYDDAHSLTAEFINAKFREEVIFTRNTTESLNLVAHAWGRKFIGKEDVIVISAMEHHSNIVPWQMIAEEVDAKIEWIPVGSDGLVDMDEYKKILEDNKGKVRIVSVVHISNVLGSVNPVKKIAELAHEEDAICMIDAAQSAARFEIDVQKLDADFLALSSHKMYGPTGIGVLYGKKKFLEQMDPWMGGGDMIRRVNRDEYEPNDLPWKFEAGTPNIADGAVFADAIRFIQKVGMKEIIGHEQELITYAMEQMSKLEWVKIYGPRSLKKRMGVISFSVEGLHPHDMSTLLNEDGIAIRAGHHCAMPLHIDLGLPATARISLGVYNSKDDIDKFIESLKDAKKKFV